MFRKLEDYYLNRLPAVCFCFPHFFRTPFDNPESDIEQYEKGLSIGEQYKYLVIGENCVWSAHGAAEGYMSTSLHSYERIGYHRSTAALLAGFIASGIRIEVYREYGDGFTELNELSDYTRSRVAIRTIAHQEASL